MIKVLTAEEIEKILFTMANPVNIIKARPPKQPVMSMVSLKVIRVEGIGRRKEKGHQIKSLSESQL